MTLSEFKAWFEGYTEGLEMTPTKAQFDRIKERVKEIDGAPITYPIYIDRYIPQPWHPIQYWNSPYVTTSQTGQFATRNMDCAAINNVQSNFNSTDAMYALGKTEAMN